MAIVKDKNATGNSRVQQAAPSRDFERAAAFLNINLPKKNASAAGKRLVSLPLLASNPDHVALMEWLEDEATQEGRLAGLKSKFIVQYQVVESAEEGGFDLS